MNDIEKRKQEHLEINLQKDVSSARSSGFENYAFTHEALPEIDLAHVKTDTRFLEKSLNIPLLISSMTGGTPEGSLINLRLAEAANETGVAMGVGSQRADLERKKSEKHSNIREIAPNIPLYANLGAVQLNYGFTVNDCKKAVDLIRADALILHLNPLQEALQPEGQTNFYGLAKKIELVCKAIEVPVIVKEVGWGISASTARKLIELGVSAIDVAGAGGTSWSEVEKHRSDGDRNFRLAGNYRDWGIPTADAVVEAREALPGTPIVASGGMNTGIEVAKAIALGANIAGVARPFLIAANESTEAVISKIQEIRKELRITMFVVGAGTIDALASTHIQLRSS